MVLSRKAMCIALAGVGLSSAILRAQQPTKAPALPHHELLYGFALECVDCDAGMRGRVGGGGSATPDQMSDKSYPHVIAVAPGGAAELAGIRPGDVLQEIDGLSVLSPRGAERFAKAAAGQDVRLGLERNGKAILASLVLGRWVLPANGTREMNVGYMSINGQLHGGIRMDFWTDEPIYTIPDSVAGTITFQIGRSTIIRMKYTKDSTDRANRPPTKNDDSPRHD